VSQSSSSGGGSRTLPRPLPPFPRASASAGVSGSWAGEAEEWQDSGGVAGVAAQGGGDIAVAMEAQDADRVGYANVDATCELPVRVDHGSVG
jgi:hypothetical protein